MWRVTAVYGNTAVQFANGFPLMDESADLLSNVIHTSHLLILQIILHAYGFQERDELSSLDCPEISETCHSM
jgi:hypothetical protein